MTENLPSDDVSIVSNEGSQSNSLSEVFSLRINVDSSEVIMVEGAPHDGIDVDGSEIGRSGIVLKRILIN